MKVDETFVECNDPRFFASYFRDKAIRNLPTDRRVALGSRMVYRMVYDRHTFSEVVCRGFGTREFMDKHIAPKSIFISLMSSYMLGIVDDTFTGEAYTPEEWMKEKYPVFIVPVSEDVDLSSNEGGQDGQD